MDHAHGITRIDTGFFRDDFDAAWLIVEDGRAAFVDTGINASLPRLLGALEAKGLGVEAVDWVIPTHVHLDHAGGAGQLMRRLPNARLVIHPRGAPHMIDPTRLIAGASAVYGADEVQRTYGDIAPVPAKRVVEAPDGFTVDLAGRRLLCLDTPGHARHHLCVWDARSRSFFTGDTFGLSYREFDTANGAFILPTTTPSQFDPGELRSSIDRLCSYEPEAMLLTHYGRVTGVPRLAADLRTQIDAMAAIAREHKSATDRHERITSALADLYVSRALAHGVDMPPDAIRECLAMDIELNAQGLGIWVDR
ncbi:MAG TPA: MBL fold metallo-hydrolase [Dokdonella sp.]|uniref:MBL fold metallo-hydrolase n=1 Tax=Dokdonella sp. TaxID=2291710 RepID=UPI0025C2F372|nr:MBL fold metallo-hydrolase [Dokdonella sp.]MBX3693072.1 MBL fold metallo-hydrolase [Dokdonella sp.]MCW5567349.1 MBL fold metallo-hydrolase [Dokdonella sp.]HNR91563.1 MBL fold metallo-hydrolase [Dokdonella sp.]